jgi:hypothetical protein
VIDAADYQLFRRAVIGLVESQITLIEAATPHVAEPDLQQDLGVEATRLRELVFDLEASAP